MMRSQFLWNTKGFALSQKIAPSYHWLLKNAHTEFHQCRSSIWRGRSQRSGQFFLVKDFANHQVIGGAVSHVSNWYKSKQQTLLSSFHRWLPDIEIQARCRGILSPGSRVKVFYGADWKRVRNKVFCGTWVRVL